MENSARPIIIIKKKVGHGGHHGGAWKVAYADFVTAMMALFIVLWLLNTSKPVREAIAGYFRDPSGTANKLAQELGRAPNRISIEGHTDSRPFAKRGDYGNWELSVDRANAARRLMQQNGVRPDQISQVRGFADQMLRKSNDPQDPSNRRISLIVQYINKDQQQPENANAGEAKAPDAGPKER
jgi:flagellar motor protein MotB